MSPAGVIRRGVIATLLLAATSSVAPRDVAGATRYDPALRFQSLVTPHFVIHYHQGEEAQALRLSLVAEAVHADLVARMKKATVLTVQAIHMNGQAMSPQLDLKDFAKAYDGPPTDPKVFEAQQKKLQDELQKRADEARRKLEEMGIVLEDTPKGTRWRRLR